MKKKKKKKVVNMEKEQTPPLLLMNPSENVTFNNAHGGNLLMPVTQDMQTIFAAGKRTLIREDQIFLEFIKSLI